MFSLILVSALSMAPEGAVNMSLDPPPQPEINTPAEAFDLATLAVNAFRKKKYGVFTGILLMLMVFGLRRTKMAARLPKEYAPWIACGLGILFSIGTVLAADRPPLTAITHGFVLGAAATGLWEMVGKYLLPPPRS